MVRSSTQKQVLEKYRPYVAHRQQRKAEVRSRLQKRHQAGLKQAKELAEILKTEFGATKAVLFGSMLCVNDVHMGSDIDLAVWNLPSKEYFAAVSRMMDAHDFAVDLVRIEEAPPSLRSHILEDGLLLDRNTPDCEQILDSDRSMPNYGVLISKLRRILSDLKAEYEYAQGQASTARETKQDVYWTSVGLSLHSFYTGLEKAFELIAKQVDDTLDTSTGRWHKALLDQMTLNLPGVRPPVINKQAYRYLDRFLSFRQVIRSNYAHRLDPEGIAANFEMLEDCYGLVSQQLNDFCDFLASVD